MKRKKALAKNTLASVTYQVTTVLCGFVLPRLILKVYGSDVNGLVQSITQFLQIIGFLELGVGAVVQSTLYKPLADKDMDSVSKIIVSAGGFYKKIAIILLVYTTALVIVYPSFGDNHFAWGYTATLIGTMCISSFAQYYFGIVDRLLLSADQRGYVQYTAQTITVLLNTIASVFIIRSGASIQLVKLVTSLIYLARPFVLRFYVNKHYSLNRKIKYDTEPIKQKWDGIAQHVSAVILDGTDTIVLTVFSTLKNVSIYSVYHMVVYGIKQLVMSMTNGMQALMGELWAKQELDNLKSFFGWVEWIIHTGTVYVFTCTGALILPFVSIYTAGISDAEYIQPLFAFLITCANAMHCLRLPYALMIMAGGHYKQTQKSYIVAALMNLVISIVTVHFWGLIGVAIGTLCAMLYQTIWMAIYNSHNFIHWPLVKFVKQLVVDTIVVLISMLIVRKLGLSAGDYLSWMKIAVFIAVIIGVVAILVNLIFYFSKMKYLVRKILHN